MARIIKYSNFIKFLVWFPVLIICTIYSQKTLDDHPVKFTALAIYLLIFIGGVFILKKDKISAPEFTDSKILLLMFAYLLYSAYGLFISGNFSDGIFDLYKLVLVMIFAILIMRYISFEVLLAELPKAFIILAFILSIAGLCDLLNILKQGKLSIPHDTYEIKALFGHRNLYAQLLFFAFPFCFYFLIYVKSKMWKLLAYISYTISLFLLIILSNRATWLALLLGVGLIAITYIYTYKKRDKLPQFKLNWSNYRNSLIITFIVIALTFLFIKAFSDVSGLRTHTENIVDPDAGSTKDRIYLWGKTLQLIKEKPYAGHGLSTWKFNILKYGNEGLESQDHRTFYQTPHNDFLWVLSEQGIIGLLLYLAIFMLLLRQICKNISASASQQELLFNAVILFLFSGYCIYSVFSFPKDRLEDLLVFSLIIGITFSRRNDKPAANIFPKLMLNNSNVVFLSTAILIAFGLFIGINRYKAEVHLKIAMNAKESGNYERVISEIRRAENKWYNVDPFSTPLSWYEGSAYYNLGHYDKALLAFEHAYVINPYHLHTLNNLASCYEIKNDHSKAIQYYQKALAVAPDFAEAWLNLAAVYFNQKAVQKAYEAVGNISVNSVLPSYRHFIMVILKSAINELLASKPNKTFQQEWEINLNNEQWYFNLHQKLKSNNTSIAKLIASY